MPCLLFFCCFLLCFDTANPWLVTQTITSSVISDTISPTTSLCICFPALVSRFYGFPVLPGHVLSALSHSHSAFRSHPYHSTYFSHPLIPAFFLRFFSHVLLFGALSLSSINFPFFLQLVVRLFPLQRIIHAEI